MVQESATVPIHFAVRPRANRRLGLLSSQGLIRPAPRKVGFETRVLPPAGAGSRRRRPASPLTSRAKSSLTKASRHFPNNIKPLVPQHDEQDQDDHADQESIAPDTAVVVVFPPVGLGGTSVPTSDIEIETGPVAVPTENHPAVKSVAHNTYESRLGEVRGEIPNELDDTKLSSPNVSTDSTEREEEVRRAEKRPTLFKRRSVGVAQNHRNLLKRQSMVSPSALSKVFLKRISIQVQPSLLSCEGTNTLPFTTLIPREDENQNIKQDILEEKDVGRDAETGEDTDGQTIRDTLDVQSVFNPKNVRRLSMTLTDQSQVVQKYMHRSELLQELTAQPSTSDLPAQEDARQPTSSKNTSNSFSRVHAILKAKRKLLFKKRLRQRTIAEEEESCTTVQEDSDLEEEQDEDAPGQSSDLGNHDWSNIQKNMSEKNQKRKSVGHVMVSMERAESLESLCIPRHAVKDIRQQLQESDRNLSWETLILEAFHALKEQAWRRALLISSVCLACDPTWIQALFIRSRVFGKLGLVSMALRDMDKILDLQPTHWQVQLARASIHHSMKSYDAAHDDIRVVLYFHPNCSEALRLKGAFYIDEGQFDQATQYLDAAISTKPNDWHGYYERGLLRHRIADGEMRTTSNNVEEVGFQDLLTLILYDYMCALQTGCDLIECIESYGDICVRLFECTTDAVIFTEAMAHLVNLEPRLGHSRTLECALRCQVARFKMVLQLYPEALVDIEHALDLNANYPIVHFYHGTLELGMLAPTRAKNECPTRQMTSTLALIRAKLNLAATLDSSIVGIYIVRGAVYLHERNYRLALHDFRLALAIDPTCEELWLQVAQMYLRDQYNSSRCIHACAQALIINHTTREVVTLAYYLQGEAYMTLNDFRQALRMYQRLMVRFPVENWTTYLQARVLCALGEPRAALYAFLQYTSSSGSSSADIQKLKGQALSCLHFYEDAIVAFREALRNNPTIENACLLSKSLFDSGDRMGASRVIQQHTSSSSGLNETQDTIVCRAKCFESIENYAQAAKEYGKALKLDRVRTVTGEVTHAPQVLYFTRALCYIRQYVSQLDPLSSEPPNRKKLANLYTKAIDDLTVAVKHDPLYTPAYVQRAELRMIQAEYAEAQHDCELALRIDATDLRARVNLGLIHDHFRSYAAAIGSYDLAIQARVKGIRRLLVMEDPMALVYYNRGVAYQALGCVSQAQEDYSRCLELWPDNVLATRNRSLCRSLLGDFRGCLEDLRVLLSQGFPHDLNLLTLASHCLVHLNEFKQAFDALETLLSIDPHALEPLIDRGNLYLALASKAGSSHAELQNGHERKRYLFQALRAYVKAVHMYPTTLSLRLNLGYTYQLLEDWSEALVHYSHVIDEATRLRRETPKGQAELLELLCQGLEGRTAVRFHLGQFHEALDDMNEAIERCILSDPVIQATFFHQLHANQLPFQSTYSQEHTGSSEENVGEEQDRAHLLTPQSSPEGKESSTTSVKEERKKIPPPCQDLKYLLALIHTPAGATLSSKQYLCRLFINRGIILEAQGELSQARDAYRIARECNPYSKGALFGCGSMELVQHRLPEALACFQQILKRNPTDVPAWLNLGVAFAAQRDWPSARRAMETVLELEPDHGPAWANHGMILEHLMMEEEQDVAVPEQEVRAIQSYCQAIEALPSDPALYVRRGNLMARQSRMHEAMHDFATAVFLDPNIQL